MKSMILSKVTQLAESNQLKCGIVILSYESREPLQSCLRSAFAQNYENKEVIVVDNASKDGSARMVTEKFPQAALIRNPVNGGTAAINLGIERALKDGCEYILLVDSDAILDAGVASILISFLILNPTIGVAGPSGYELNRAGGAPVVRVDEKTLLLRTERYTSTPSETDCIGMAMVKRDVFEKVGMIDKAYFAYYQDTDFSLKARRAGFRIFIVPEAKFHHLGAYTTGKVIGLRGLISIRNRCMLLRKNFPPSKYLPFVSRIPFELFKVSGQWLLKREIRELQATFVGTASGIVFLLSGRESALFRKIETSILSNKVSLE